MFGRKLRSRLDLLWPHEAVSSKVFDRQQKQKEHHSKQPRVLSGSEGDPVLIRNYATGRKWLPATIESQTGPISYKCKLSDGSVVPRHQDQMLSTSLMDQHSGGSTVIPSPQSLGGKSRSFPLLLETGEIQAESPSISDSQPYQDNSEMIDGAFRESEVPLRRSNRICKPVERLNL